MLVFHGTGGERSLVDKIFAEGLVPHGHDWAHRATGLQAQVFACTTPVGTRGGDPIHFAQRATWGDRNAWLVVLDIEPSSVRGAVPNGELEQYWHVRTFADVAFDSDMRKNAPSTRGLIALKRERRCDARELLAYRVVSTATDLCDGEPDAHTLIQFEHAYMRASTSKEKARVAASYGLRIPEDFASDSHSPWCSLCMFQLFHIEIVVPDSFPTFDRGYAPRLELATFGALVDALDRWLAAAGDPPYSRFADLQRKHPPPLDAVPRTFRADFATADLALRTRQPDTQLLLDHVPPDRIVGAIDLGSRDRLSPLVRPRDGETLIDKLWYLARELADRRRAAGRPLVLD